VGVGILGREDSLGMQQNNSLSQGDSHHQSLSTLSFLAFNTKGNNYLRTGLAKNY
jgi:hypothetical protein